MQPIGYLQSDPHRVRVVPGVVTELCADSVLANRCWLDSPLSFCTPFRHFRKQYKARFLVPHPKKSFAYLRDCIADCPTNAVDRFWHAPLMRPHCESCSTRDFYASSRDHCASDCLEHGPARCASFSYSYTVSGGGRCRHYQRAYDCKYLRAARSKDFYVLAVPQCRS